jgi:hypothetical protein
LEVRTSVAFCGIARKTTVQMQQGVIKWALMAVGPLPKWAFDRVILLGDAVRGLITSPRCGLPGQLIVFPCTGSLHGASFGAPIPNMTYVRAGPLCRCRCRAGHRRLGRPRLRPLLPLVHSRDPARLPRRGRSRATTEGDARPADQRGARRGLSPRSGGKACQRSRVCAVNHTF